MKYIITLLLILFSISVKAQVRGKITDAGGEAITFGSIVEKNTLNAASPNEYGSYVLNLEKGNYVLIFRALGFKTREISVSIQKVPHILNVSLEKQTYNNTTVNINTDGNKIIAKAIFLRRQNSTLRSKFEADFYSRGVVRLKEVPKDILGQELGDLGGSLDSTRSGILYLSETISKLKRLKHGRLSERIIASKISGEDNGYSFNNASSSYFDFYQNFLPLEVNVVSPLADNALNYYDFKLENLLNEGDFIIYKIKVTPKRAKDPALTGYIYILNNSYELYATDLTIKGSQIQQPLFNTISIQQQYTYNTRQNLWAITSQLLTFDAGLLGVVATGTFTYVYRNYNFEPEFTKSSFGYEVLSFEADAAKRENQFWYDLRPVPLTRQEINDYNKNDSIRAAEQRKSHKDSIDKLRNRLTIASAALGYTYHNTAKNWTASYSGIIRRLSFNTVQAYNLAPGFYFTKTDAEKKTYTRIGTDLNYGFAEKRFRATGTLSRKYNNFTDAIITLSGGSNIKQFNPEEPINRIVNSVSTLFFRDNYMKLYDNNFIKLNYQEEVVNGLYLYGSIEYTRRRGLFNNTNFSTLKDKYKPYTSNNPLLPYDYNTPAFTKHSLIKTSIAARITFAQQYRLFPDGKENLLSKYPRLYLNYEKGFAATNSNYNFDHLSTRIAYDKALGTVGEFGANLKLGKFLNRDDISFVDFKHFNGNRTHVGTRERYLNVFNLLPYYTHSTNDAYFEVHAEHDFKGFVLNKVPLLNRLNYHIVTGFHMLAVPERNTYTEYSVGLDNVGWGKARFLRIDYVRSYEGGFRDHGVILGLTFLNILE